MSLSNKLALVTGAAGGIGSCIVNLFAKEGATIIAVDFNERVHEVANNLDKSLNQQHSSFICDVSNSDQVSQLFADIKEKYPKEKVPNVVVNCAGIYIPGKLIETTDETFDKIVGVNLKGPFLITRAAAKELVKNFPEVSLNPLDTYASIINISSVAAKSSFPDSQCVYTATKGGLDSMSMIFAYELAQYKIRVNSLAPGPIQTPLCDEEMARRCGSKTYFNRMGEPIEIARACLFLASDQSSFFTGSTIDCDAGFHRN